jgi:hypothetical protein
MGSWWTFMRPPGGHRDHSRSAIRGCPPTGEARAKAGQDLGSPRTRSSSTSDRSTARSLRPGAASAASTSSAPKRAKQSRVRPRWSGPWSLATRLGIAVAARLALTQPQYHRADGQPLGRWPRPPLSPCRPDQGPDLDEVPAGHAAGFGVGHPPGAEVRDTSPWHGFKGWCCETVHTPRWYRPAAADAPLDPHGRGGGCRPKRHKRQGTRKRGWEETMGA